MVLITYNQEMFAGSDRTQERQVSSRQERVKSMSSFIGLRGPAQLPENIGGKRELSTLPLTEKKTKI